MSKLSLLETRTPSEACREILAGPCENGRIQLTARRDITDSVFGIFERRAAASCALANMGTAAVEPLEGVLEGVPEGHDWEHRLFLEAIETILSALRRRGGEVDTNSPTAPRKSLSEPPPS